MYLYFQRKDFREFGPYFFDKPYLFLEVSDNKKICKNFAVHEVLQFNRVVEPSYYNKAKRRKIYFDMDTIKKGVRIVNIWRRNRDSNSGKRLAPSSFRNCPLRPLEYFSVLKLYS